MLVYSGLKTDFLNSVEEGTIASEIEKTIYEKMGRKTPDSEFRSWENSLQSMYIVMNDPQIPGNSGVAIEYNIPQTSKRVDFKMTPYMVPAAFDGKMGNTMECTVFVTPQNQLVVVVMNRTEADMIFELKLDDLGIKDKKEKTLYTSKVTDKNVKNCFVCPPRGIQTYIFEQ
jgi:hypothetical protein